MVAERSIRFILFGCAYGLAVLASSLTVSSAFAGDLVWRLPISGVLAGKSARYRVLSKMAVKIRQQILGALVGGGPILQLMQRL